MNIFHSTKYGRTIINNFNLNKRFFCEANETKSKIDKIIKNNKVVVFMKGIPDSPRCGFSNAVIQILRMHGATFDSYDVLEDESLRNGIKEYSDWPTIPQIYVNGEFIGGCDIMIQMHRNGELIETLKNAGIRSALLNFSEKETNES